jgi:hypothetical protein
MADDHRGGIRDDSMTSSPTGDADSAEGRGRPDPVLEAAEAFVAMTQQFASAASSGAANVVMQPIAQLEAMVRDIAARRDQVQALVAQLNAFDEQLAAFERTLVPLLEWSRGWARMSGAADPLGLTRRPPPA